MGERVAIVGSRGYPDLEEVMAYVSTLPLDTVVVSGGAWGVDQHAEGTARAQGLTVVSFLPRQLEGHWRIVRFTLFARSSDSEFLWLSYRDLGSFPEAAHFRNGLIVQDSDRVEVFWDGHSRGTRNTIRLAEKAGKLGEIHRAGVRA